MSDRMSFEERLAQALRDYADEAVMPFDPDAITDAAVATPAGPPPWIRPAALAVAGLAAVLVLAVVASQFIDRPLGFGGPTMIEESDLPHIVANGSNTPGDWNQTLDETGPAVLRTPMRSSRLGPVDGFVNGRTTEMCRVEASGNETDCTLAWVALYATEEEAQDALGLIISEFESPDGWGFPPGSGEPAPGLGDQSALYRDVQDPTGAPLTAIYLWREGPLLLAVSGIDDMPLETIREIADQMQERAVDP